MIREAKALFRRILHTDDTPHKIAWGVALGMFVAWTPTVGIQMIVAGILAWLLRGNVAAAVAIVWVSNPYTIVPLYYSNYLIGNALVGGRGLDEAWFADLLDRRTMTFWEYLIHAYEKLIPIFGQMFLGGVIAGVPIAVVSYILTYRAVVKFREHQRKKAEEEARSETRTDHTSSSTVVGQPDQADRSVQSH